MIADKTQLKSKSKNSKRSQANRFRPKHRKTRMEKIKTEKRNT